MPNDEEIDRKSAEPSPPVSDIEEPKATGSDPVPAEVSEFLRLIARVLRRLQEPKGDNRDDS